MKKWYFESSRVLVVVLMKTLSLQGMHVSWYHCSVVAFPKSGITLHVKSHMRLWADDFLHLDFRWQQTLQSCNGLGTSYIPSTLYTPSEFKLQHSMIMWQGREAYSSSISQVQG